MRHYFKAEKQNVPGSFDIVWFDSKKYTEEQAEGKFEEAINPDTMEKEYIIGGNRYSKITYLGEYDLGWRPMSEKELLDAIFDDSGILDPK